MPTRFGRILEPHLRRFQAKFLGRARSLTHCVPHTPVKVIHFIFGLLIATTCGIGIALAQNKVGDVQGFKDCAACSEMVVIPGGSFEMGAPDSELDEDENETEGRHPRHHVSIRTFALGKNAITRGQFAAFVKATGYQAGDSCFTNEPVVMEESGPSIVTDEGSAERKHRSWQNPGFPQTDNHPAVCLNWSDAIAFAKWISEKTGKNYRLPTEAEWEYAARAGSTTARYWGTTDEQQCTYANALDLTSKDALRGPNWGIAMCSDGYVYTAPVGRFKPNAFGLYDMLGNAGQWLEDCWHENYVGAPTDGSAWTTGECTQRISRGGSWNSSPRLLRVDSRGSLDVNERHNMAGFRLARDLSDDRTINAVQSK